MFANKVTIADNVEIQSTLTITGQTTITTGTASNDYSKAEANHTLANLIDSTPAALNTLKELASALGNDANPQQPFKGNYQIRLIKLIPTQRLKHKLRLMHV